MAILGVIPARYGSTRLPGKPLKLVGNLPMVVRTYQQAYNAQLLDALIVATDDIVIHDVCEMYGIPCYMTSDKHVSGTDRVAEAVSLYESEVGREVTIVVNIQGDMPLVDPEVIDQLVRLKLRRLDSGMVTVTSRECTEEKFISINAVKCIVDNKTYEVVDYDRIYPGTKDGYFIAVGMYAFNRAALKTFSQLKPGPKELRLNVEQLRYIEIGCTIPTVIVDRSGKSVNTQEDLFYVNQIIRRNSSGRQKR